MEIGYGFRGVSCGLGFTIDDCRNGKIPIYYLGRITERSEYAMAHAMAHAMAFYYPLAPACSSGQPTRVDSSFQGLLRHTRNDVGLQPQPRQLHLGAPAHRRRNITHPNRRDTSGGKNNVTMAISVSRNRHTQSASRLTAAQWKSFDFFDVTQVTPADDDTRNFLESGEISSVCSGSESLFLGSDDGYVRIIGPSWKIVRSFQAHETGSVRYMRQVEGTSLLVTVAVRRRMSGVGLC